jgi:hypothetical protein
MYALKEYGVSFRAVETQCEQKYLRFSQLALGMPKGALVEISGRKNAEAAFQFLLENPGMPVAWIEQDLKSLSIERIPERLNVAKILFFDGNKDSSWAASTVINSKEFPVVVYHAPYGEEKELRRWQLQAEKAGVTVILLRDEPCVAWPISLQMRANHPLNIEVLRRR